MVFLFFLLFGNSLAHADEVLVHATCTLRSQVKCDDCTAKLNVDCEKILGFISNSEPIFGIELDYGDGTSERIPKTFSEKIGSAIDVLNSEWVKKITKDSLYPNKKAKRVKIYPQNNVQLYVDANRKVKSDRPSFTKLRTICSPGTLPQLLYAKNGCQKPILCIEKVICSIQGGLLENSLESSGIETSVICKPRADGSCPQPDECNSDKSLGSKIVQAIGVSPTLEKERFEKIVNKTKE